MPPMAKLDHVAVEVSDLDAAIEFYKQKIGLKFLFKKVDSRFSCTGNAGNANHFTGICRKI